MATGACVHGTPPGRPENAPRSSDVLVTSGTRGSRSGMSNCTGPGFPVRAPRADANTRPTAERHWLFASRPSSASPMLIAARTCVPKIPNCSTV
ncbi:Uncharacterised protein [Mycobacteroides abscessus subsp. abscessus]|nr:Uncharacterised protein [Mycobacteroides abscessus subsp. abscessus]